MFVIVSDASSAHPSRRSFFYIFYYYKRTYYTASIFCVFCGGSRAYYMIHSKQNTRRVYIYIYVYINQLLCVFFPASIFLLSKFYLSKWNIVQ